MKYYKNYKDSRKKFFIISMLEEEQQFYCWRYISIGTEIDTIEEF